MSFRVKRIATHLFIFTHVFIILVWSFPTEMKYKERLDRFFESYLYYLGIWQGWDMFAPNPRSTKLKMDAYVYYQDGSKKIWEFPQMEKLSYFDRLQKERYRKWAHDNIRTDSCARLWKPTAEFIARQMQEPNNPVVRVELNRHWSELTLVGLQRTIASTDWQHYKFYEYDATGHPRQ